MWWAVPATFKTQTFSYSEPVGRFSYFTLGGIILVVVSYILPWLNSAPKNFLDKPNIPTDALLIMGGNGGGAVGLGGISRTIVGVDVRVVLLVLLIVEAVTFLMISIKPMFIPLLLCSIFILAGPIYFLIQLISGNSASQVLSFLGLGFYGTIIGGICILGSSFFYLKRPSKATSDL